MENRLDSIRLQGNELEAKGLSNDEIRSIAAAAAEKAYADNRPIKLEEKASGIENESRQNESGDNKVDSPDSENQKPSTLSDTLRSLQTPKVEPPVVPKPDSVNEQTRPNIDSAILHHLRNSQGR